MGRARQRAAPPLTPRAGTSGDAESPSRSIVPGSAAAAAARLAPADRAGWADRAWDAAGTVVFVFLFVTGQALLRALFRIRIEGRARLAPGEPAIIAANHASYLDPVFLQLAVPRWILFLMTDAFYRVRWMSWFFRLVGCLPVADVGRAGNVATLREASRLLSRGRTLGIFPEGGLSRDGVLQRGHSGVARLMLQTGVRALPVGIVGSFDVMSRPRPRLRLFRPVTIRIGEPIAPPKSSRADGEPESATRAKANELTREIMEAIARLTGQPYAPPPAG